MSELAKMRARSTVQYAVRTGALHRADVCENCDRPGLTQGHHEDYSRPLDVIWLCRSCHSARHAGPREPRRLTYLEMLRWDRGLTRQEVAEYTGVSVGTVRSMELGGVEQPSPKVAKALANFYGITVAELLGVNSTERAA